MKQSEYNLTRGAVHTLLVRFALPLFFSNLLQACYNIADMVIVGRFVGSAGVAAVSNASTLCFIVTSIGIGIAVGGTVLAAKFRGAGNTRVERDIVGTLFTVMVLAALPVSLCSYTLSRHLFLQLAVPPEALDEACNYIKIQSFGTIFVFGYNAIGALLRGFGDSQRPLIFISIATGINIAFLLGGGMFNQYGVTAAAAAGIGLKISTLAGMPCWAVGQAVTAMAAQNLGAGKVARTAATIRNGILLSLAATGSAVLMIQLFAEPLIGYFDSDPEVIRSGVLYLRIFSSWSGVAYAVMYTCDAFATGTGAPSLALFNAMLEALLLRLPLCWFFGTHLEMGFSGICWGMALSTLPPAVIGAAYYKRGKWRNRADNY